MELKQVELTSLLFCCPVFLSFAWFLGTEKKALLEPFLNRCSLWRQWEGRLPLSSSYSTHYCWGAFFMLPAQQVSIFKLSFGLSALALFIMDKRRVRILTKYLSDWKGNINASSVLDCMKLIIVLTLYYCNFTICAWLKSWVRVEVCELVHCLNFSVYVCLKRMKNRKFLYCLLIWIVDYLLKVILMCLNVLICAFQLEILCLWYCIMLWAKKNFNEARTLGCQRMVWNAWWCIWLFKHQENLF